MTTISKKTYTLYVSILILILAICYSYQLRYTTDIDLWDEINYLNNGLKNPFSSYRFIYPLWYKFLHLFVKEKIDLFYFNQTVLCIVLPISFFYFLTVLFDNLLLPFIFSILLLYSVHNLGSIYYITNTVYFSNHHINHFALCIYFIYLYVVTTRFNNYSVLLKLLFLFFILGFTRHEYSLIFWILMLLNTFIFYKNYKTISFKEKKIFFYFLIIIFFTTLLVGIPFLDKNYSSGAYIMAYSTNYYYRHHMLINQYSDVIHPFYQNFQDGDSLFKAFLSDTPEFINNLFYNVNNIAFYFCDSTLKLFFPKLLLKKHISILLYIIYAKIIISMFYNLFYVNKKFINNYFITGNIVMYSAVLLILPTIGYSVIYYFDPKFYLFFIPVIFFLLKPFINFSFSRYEPFFISLLFIILLLNNPKTKDLYSSNNIPIRTYIYKTLMLIENLKKEKYIDTIKVMCPYGYYEQIDSSIKTIYPIAILYDNKYKPLNLQNTDVFVTDKDFISTQIYQNMDIDSILNNKKIKRIYYNDFMNTKFYIYSR